MLKIYSTLTRKKEEFKPLKGNKVNLFVCGITPYDYAHIGHAKTYIQFDIIVKYLRYKKYKVFYLQNITDIDDKIINRAKELNMPFDKLAREYEKCYYEDMKSLGVNSVDKYARATDFIKDIVSQIERLMKKGFAYKISDGIYFDLTKFKDYGELSGRTTSSGEDAVSRIDENIEKKNKGDFCLWKYSKESEPSWETELKKGRPGWHIEDTAITEKEFGPQYDIHGGAKDLIFPHHEAEIAQMESISGKKPLVKYWLHTGFLNVSGQKMSKSLGNFFTIRDILKKYNAKTLRFLFIQTHYRSAIDFSESSLESAKNSLERLNDFMMKLKTGKDNLPDSYLKKVKENFIKAMDDDFDTPKALAVIFNLVKEANTKGGGKKAYSLMLEFDKIFNILDYEGIKMPSDLKELLKKREEARKNKDYKKADILRDKIKQKGYIIEDSDKGLLLKKI